MKVVGDSGPIYTETDMSRLPVEPFNTFSNLVFLLVIAYWWRKLKTIKDRSFRRLLLIGLPILFVGYVGGSIYHGTRTHNIWLIMDFMPIIILSLFVSMYMWRKVMDSYWKITAYMLVLTLVPRWLLQQFFDVSSLRISLGYLLLTIPIVYPMVIFEIKHNWRGKKELLATIACILVAISFRVFDSSGFVQTYVPIGTHWLWHLFGGLTTHLLLIYLSKHTIGLD